MNSTVVSMEEVLSFLIGLRLGTTSLVMLGVSDMTLNYSAVITAGPWPANLAVRGQSTQMTGCRCPPLAMRNPHHLGQESRASERPAVEPSGM